MDMRLDSLGRITVLEANANPGISAASPVSIKKFWVAVPSTAPRQA